jgi:hypothetical protein
MRLVLLLTMCRLAGDGPVRADGPAAEVPFEQQRIYWASTDRKVASDKGGGGRYGVITHGIEPAADGTPEVRGLYLTPNYAHLDADVRPSTAFYPRLREGDLIPGYNGQVCAVGRLEVPKRGDPSTFSFRTAPKPPPGTALQPDGYGVPLKGADGDPALGTLRLTKQGHYSVWVDAVAAPADGPRTADLRLQYEFGEAPKAATVRAGDVLFYTGVGYRVVNVVPKDPKTRVIGWVEFDPKALPTGDEAKAAAEKAGGKVVVPTAPKKK